MSDFATLDFLERYGLGTAYKTLMLGARSASDFQRLCEEVVPENCRLPRTRIIDLKRERTRWLGTGDQPELSGSKIRARPSDAELRALFLSATRRERVDQKHASLVGYYVSLLHGHSSDSHSMLLPGETEQGFGIASSPRGRSSYASGSFGGTDTRFEFKIRRRLVEAAPPEGYSPPDDLQMMRRETKLQVIVNINEDQLTFARCEQLLQLPPWRHVNGYNNYTSLYYVLPVTEGAIASWFDNGDQQELSMDGLERLRDFLTFRGIQISSLVPGP